MDFPGLKKNLKKDFSALPVKRLAVLGDSATQFLVQALRGYGYTVGLNLEIYEADFDQIEQQVLSPDSELHAGRPEYVVLFFSVQHWLSEFQSLPVADRARAAELALQKIARLEAAVRANSPGAKTVLLNFPEFDDGVFGNYANKVDHSFIYQLRKLNLALMDLAREQPGLFICDVQTLAQRAGAAQTFDPKFYVSAELAFRPDFLPTLAKSITDIVLATSGQIKKCLVLDLDDTLWGGIIGDDGIENIAIGHLGTGKAFTDLQRWAKALKERGIILAVCSKNEEANARAPFVSHPEMVLRVDDIAVFVANWDSKVQNIRHIQSVLNIGFDAMVFLDDSPFERNVVRDHIPGITVPELPEEPAERLDYLRSLNLFETASFTTEDSLRTELYLGEAARTTVRKDFHSEEEFLANLHMRCAVNPFDAFSVPRVAQLSQRSNQFNLRTVRYGEADIQRIANSPEHLHFSLALRDRFGDYGLIGAVVLQKLPEVLFIDTWIMSCRVLKRGMETLTLNEIVRLAREHGPPQIVGEYLATPKNGIVRDHYARLGFTEQNGRWILEVAGYQEPSTFIEREVGHDAG